jgi:hypothetical protein
VVTTGGTGFGIMSVIVAAERKWITRDTAAKFLLKMVNFLLKANSYHGVFPHWLDGGTGKQFHLAGKMMAPILLSHPICSRDCFVQDNTLMAMTEPKENYAIALAGCGMILNGIGLQKVIEVLYWHWSPNNGWAMNFPVRGFNECLIMYVLAASGNNEKYSVGANVYHRGWAEVIFLKTGKNFMA